MNYYKIIFISIITLIIGCDNTPPVVKLFKEHIGKNVNLTGYDSLFCQEQAYSYAEFRKKHPFITVNYVDEDCASCKFKVQDWHKNTDKLPVIDNLGYVFVFRGKDYKRFLRNSLGREKFQFFIMPSTEFTYVKNNPKIDRQIIDGGFLLNKDNEIMCIGDPYTSKSMTELVKSIVSKENKD